LGWDYEIMKRAVLYVVVVLVISPIVLVGWLMWQGKILLPFQEEWTYDRAFQQAIEHKDITLCDSINRELVSKDLNYTYTYPPREVKRFCILRYISEIKSVDDCISLSDVSLRDQCLDDLATDLKRPELCELLSEIKNESWTCLILYCGSYWKDRCIVFPTAVALGAVRVGLAAL